MPTELVLTNHYNVPLTETQVNSITAKECVSGTTDIFRINHNDKTVEVTKTNKDNGVFELEATLINCERNTLTSNEVDYLYDELEQLFEKHHELMGASYSSMGALFMTMYFRVEGRWNTLID